MVATAGEEEDEERSEERTVGNPTRGAADIKDVDVKDADGSDTATVPTSGPTTSDGTREGRPPPLLSVFPLFLMLPVSGGEVKYAIVPCDGSSPLLLRVGRRSRVPARRRLALLASPEGKDEWSSR